MTASHAWTHAAKAALRGAAAAERRLTADVITDEYERLCQQI